MKFSLLIPLLLITIKTQFENNSTNALQPHLAALVHQLTRFSNDVEVKSSWLRESENHSVVFLPVAMANSYVDDIKVKISEKYKPPCRISLPMSYAQRLSLNKQLQDTRPTYELDLEKSILSRLDERKQLRSLVRKGSLSCEWLPILSSLCRPRIEKRQSSKQGASL